MKTKVRKVRKSPEERYPDTLTCLGCGGTGEGTAGPCISCGGKGKVVNSYKKNSLARQIADAVTTNKACGLSFKLAVNRYRILMLLDA